MRLITIGALGLALLAAGCEPSVSPANYPLPPELADCKPFDLSNGIDSITVVRCPNSTTSTTFRQGKHDETSVVVDGQPGGQSDSAPHSTRDALPGGQPGS
jgi:hypothetical protein